MRTADRYCDVAGFDPEAPDDAVFFAHDASACTLVEVDGARTIVSDEDYLTNVVTNFAGGIGQVLKTPGHSLTVSFESSLNTGVTIDAFVREQRERARQKGLSLNALVDEGRAVAARRARHEKVLLALWTRPEAGIPQEVRKQQGANDRLWRALPPAADAQNPHLRIDALDGPHAAFVKRVLEALGDARLQARIVRPDDQGRRRDLEEIRRALLWHETPVGWSPYGPGTRRYPEARETSSDDVGCFFAPTVARQIMTANVKASSDLRSVEIGGRRFALAVVRMFPKHLLGFNRLIEALLEGGADTSRMPFRVCLHLEALKEGDSALTLRKVIAGLLGFSSPSTKNLFRSLRDLEQVIQQDTETVIKARLLATTWVEPGEPAEALEERRGYLMQSLMTWGDAVVTDAPFNPLRALCETVPGMTLRSSVAPAALVPLSDVAQLLPFHRTAPIFHRGQSLFTTPTGRLMPYEFFSPAQLYWLTLIYATPGSGKSVLMNRLNVEFAGFMAGRVLPFLAAIDVGVSSSGMIELVRNALPPERRHEAVYVRLLNDERHAINPWDIGLGRRLPLPRERTFLENFLVTLLGATGEAATQLVPRIITRLYRLRSDLDFSSSPNIWQRGVDAEVDRAIAELGIHATEKTKWWRLVDEFMRRGRVVLAERAQRHAMPLLQDVSLVLADPEITKDFTPEMTRSMQRAVEAAVERYRLFAQPTRLDLGPARIVSIDLNDVAQRHKSAEAERNNALMFMIARHVFLSKISGYADEIGSMEFPTDAELRNLYVAYWEGRYQEIAETPKRLCMDEYHLTGGVPTIAAQVLSDVREGRKWGLEIILASQLLRDFQDLSDIASTTIILNADSNEIREEAREVFGFSEAVKRDLERFVHGPKDDRGANFLARFKLREEERWVVLNNSLGPRMLWALTTKAEDRLVRDELYRRCSVSDALDLLARRYPHGTAIDHWQRVAAKATSRDERVPAMIVDQLMHEVMASAAGTPRRGQAGSMLIAAE